MRIDWNPWKAKREAMLLAEHYRAENRELRVQLDDCSMRLEALRGRQDS